jgi:hypothetical protein
MFNSISSCDDVNIFITPSPQRSFDSADEPLLVPETKVEPKVLHEYSFTALALTSFSDHLLLPSLDSSDLSVGTRKDKRVRLQMKKLSTQGAPYKEYMGLSDLDR